MATVVKSGRPSIGTANPPAGDRLTGLKAGEDLAQGDAVYIATDGLIYRSTAAAANPAAVVDGFAASPTTTGEPVTLLANMHIKYATGMQPGTFLYLSATAAGALDTASSANQTKPIARVVDSTRIFIMKSY